MQWLRARHGRLIPSPYLYSTGLDGRGVQDSLALLMDMKDLQGRNHTSCML